MSYTSWFLLLTLLAGPATAQPADTTAQTSLPTNRPQQEDIADFLHARLPNWKRIVPHDSSRLQTGGKFVSLIPQIGYSLQTGLLAQMLVNVAFQRPGANLSTISSSVTYTIRNQLILALTPAIWSPQNQIAWVGDWRLMHYPQATYGLGVVNTSLDRPISMNYEYLRITQRVLKRIGPSLYGGFGYGLDLHWNIVSRNQNSDVAEISGYRYGVQGRSVSSGPLLSLQFDNRTNSLNPTQGYYARLYYRPSLKLLGSDQTYQSLLIEGRTYLHPSARSQNVLAFWSYNALTLSGNPPFLDLPSTGWDTYGNTGRGYVQGRFRGKNLLYVETEYRFGLTRNRLLGGVVFANAQTVNEVSRKDFQRVAPAVGAGLRLNMNKIARTNLAIDYAFGVNGSHGLFFNFGEVF